MSDKKTPNNCDRCKSELWSWGTLKFQDGVAPEDKKRSVNITLICKSCKAHNRRRVEWT